MPTKISWCDETINPVVGCSKTSAGCQNCYAENMARRLATMGEWAGKAFAWKFPQYSRVISEGITSAGKWNGDTAFAPSELEKPYQWKNPRTVFVSSMGDLFHDSVDIKWQISVMDMVAALPRHTFIFLTKRPHNMRQFIMAWTGTKVGGYLPNLVLGVSAEDQTTADERIPQLLRTPAAKRFVSIEPMIGPVKLNLATACDRNCGEYQDAACPGTSGKCVMQWHLDGVILGGESGPKARPLDPAWVRLVRDQCETAGVPFMFKQASGRNSSHWRQYCDGHSLLSDGLPVLDGRIHRALAWETKHAI